MGILCANRVFSCRRRIGLDVVREVVANLELDELGGFGTFGFVDEDGGVPGEVKAGREMIFAPPEGVGETDADAAVCDEGEWLGVGGFVGHQGDGELAGSGRTAAGDVKEPTASDVGACGG